MAATANDVEAARRLYREVAQAYADPSRTEIRNDNQLHAKTKIARATLTGYFRDGVQPDAGNLRRIAEALGLDYTTLWCRWLDIPLPSDALVRIAEALERAYPPPDPAVAVGVARAEAVSRSAHGPQGSVAPSTQRAPRKTTGSAG